MCLAQGHNTVTLVRLESTAKYSTTEPLHSLLIILAEDDKTITNVVIKNNVSPINSKTKCIKNLNPIKVTKSLFEKCRKQGVSATCYFNQY